MSTWKPTPRQEDFLAIPDTIKEALYGGAAGGGKSEVLLNLPLVRQFHQDPKFKGIIFRRTLPELDRELIPRSQADGLYAGCGAVYKDQKKRWDFPSGAILQFGHLEHEKDVKIYDSAEYNYMGWDEGTSFTPYQYEYLSFSRCRSSSANLPAIVQDWDSTREECLTITLERDSLNYLAEQEINLLLETRQSTEDPLQGKLYFHSLSKLSGYNPHLMQNDPDYINTIQLLPAAERAAKADGDWWIYAGQVFEDLSEKIGSPTEPENAFHVIPGFTIPYFWPRLLSIDWGYAAMTHAIWWAINPLPSEKFPAKVYAYREYAAKKEKISTWAGNLRSLSHGEDIRDIVLDPSAFGHRGDEKTIAEQFADSFGRAARRADNDRIGGKVLVQEYLRWKKQDRVLPIGTYDTEVALRIRRIGGESAVKAYEQSFMQQQEEEEGHFLPKIHIFEGCKELINVIPICFYDKTNVEDVEAFDGDDPYDNLRYGLKACQYFLESGRSEASSEAERTRVLEAFQESGNNTALYMNMDRLERREKRSNMPVARRRYARARIGN